MDFLDNRKRPAWRTVCHSLVTGLKRLRSKGRHALLQHPCHVRRASRGALLDLDAKPRLGACQKNACGADQGLLLLWPLYVAVDMLPGLQNGAVLLCP